MLSILFYDTSHRVYYIYIVAYKNGGLRAHATVCRIEFVYYSEVNTTRGYPLPYVIIDGHGFREQI